MEIKAKENIKKICKNVLFDEPMKKHTSYRTGGSASIFVKPETIDEFSELIKYLNSDKITFLVMGGGSNLLVKDSGYSGVIISTKDLKEIKILKSDGTKFGIKAQAGAGTQALCRFAIENSLSGMNFATGIPGTIGGATFMNAGTAIGSISDIIDSVGFISPKGEYLTFKKEELKFFYRKLSLSHLNETFGDLIISDISFTLKKGDKENLKNEYKDLLKRRKESQPIEYPSCGSFFKNPAENPAGLLIDRCGLKGLKVGGAMVSEKHGNFLVNFENATTEDILELAQKVKVKVFSEFGITLEEEVQIVGS